MTMPAILVALASAALHCVGFLAAPFGHLARALGLATCSRWRTRAVGIDLLARAAAPGPTASRVMLGWLSLDLAWLGPRRHRWPWSELWGRSAPAAEHLLREAPPSPETEAVARALARWDPDLMSPSLSPEQAPGLLRHFEHDWGRNPFRGARRLSRGGSWMGQRPPDR